MSNCLDRVGLWACLWALVLFALVEVGKPANHMLHSSLGLGLVLFKSREENEPRGASAHSFPSAHDWKYYMKSYWDIIIINEQLIFSYKT